MNTTPSPEHYYHHRGALMGGGREEGEAEAAAFYARQQQQQLLAAGGAAAQAVQGFVVNAGGGGGGGGGDGGMETLAVAGNNVMMMMRVESEAHLPPTKRQCNNTTRVRVAAYPRLQQQLEIMLKGNGSQDRQVLVLLRQLRFLEESVGAGGKPPYTPETLESVLLDALAMAEVGLPPGGGGGLGGGQNT